METERDVLRSLSVPLGEASTGRVTQRVKLLRFFKYMYKTVKEFENVFNYIQKGFKIVTKMF